MAITRPLFNKLTSTPKERKSADIVLISDNRGALVSVIGSSVKSVAGINVRHAFFAPAMGTEPDKGPLPLIKIESICSCPYSPLASAFVA